MSNNQLQHHTKNLFTYQDIQDIFQKRVEEKCGVKTVGRYFDFFTDHLKEMTNYDLPNKLRNELEEAVLGQRVMPSMRCLMTAGEFTSREKI